MKEESLLLLSDLQKLINQVVMFDYTIIILGGETMIRENDFILNPDKLQEEFQLVEVSDWVDFSTKEKLGFYYTVLLPKLKFEKVKVGIKANTAIVTNEELEQKGQIPVSFDGLHTWASLYNGRLSVKAEASNIRKVGMK